jgi:CheY-like chemotaxis protein
MSSTTMTHERGSQKSKSGKAKYTTAMLIDDNSLDNFINKKLIETNEFAENVITFQESTEAMEFLKSSSKDKWPDVIFLDIMMPQMDGFQFLEAFEKLPEDQRIQMKVVMLSTSESFKDLNRANKNPYVRKFLNKPLTLQVLQAINV